MDESADDIDEVALNVLLADGVDFPTAWEASRREPNRTSTESGCVGSVILLIIALSAIVIVAL